MFGLPLIGPATQRKPGFEDALDMPSICHPLLYVGEAFLNQSLNGLRDAGRTVSEIE